jgi:hypothetical protein
MAVTGDSPEKHRVGIIAECRELDSVPGRRAADAVARVVEPGAEHALKATGPYRDVKNAVGIVDWGLGVALAQCHGILRVFGTEQIPKP